MSLEPLVVDGPGPGTLPAFPIPAKARSERPLFVIQREIHLRGRRGWKRIPRGYVTDFGSIPSLASSMTLSNYRPLGAHAWGALGHDWPYAIGEDGKRPDADADFLYQMTLDNVPKLRRDVMYRAVVLFGDGGYRKAKTWWDTENFADPDTGEPCPPPFARQDAYYGARYGLRDRPDWLLYE